MGAPHAAADGRREPGWYEIRLEGHRAAQRVARCDGPRLSREGDGTTRRCGPVVDQAVLHGACRCSRSSGLNPASGQVSRQTIRERKHDRYKALAVIRTALSDCRRETLSPWSQRASPDSPSRAAFQLLWLRFGAIILAAYVAAVPMTYLAAR